MDRVSGDAAAASIDQARSSTRICLWMPCFQRVGLLTKSRHSGNLPGQGIRFPFHRSPPPTMREMPSSIGAALKLIDKPSPARIPANAPLPGYRRPSADRISARPQFPYSTVDGHYCGRGTEGWDRQIHHRRQPGGGIRQDGAARRGARCGSPAQPRGLGATGRRNAGALRRKSRGRRHHFARACAPPKRKPTSSSSIRRPACPRRLTRRR